VELKCNGLVIKWCILFILVQVVAMAACHPLDWQLCIICQTNNDERVICPANTKNKEDVVNIYGQFVKNVFEFKLHNALPMEFSLDCFESTTEVCVLQTLVSNLWSLAQVLS